MPTQAIEKKHQRGKMTALVNDWKPFNDHVHDIKLIDFNISIIESLLDNEKLYTSINRATLEETAGSNVVMRKKCFLLPRSLVKEYSSLQMLMLVMLTLDAVCISHLRIVLHNVENVLWLFVFENQNL